ncbi:MAG: hypothetical protein O7C61_08720, partial [SAR324 cluster bacterium]|nr:hypothetical protein [SAR324 cluster bacterium]
MARISVRTAHLIAIALLKGVVALGHAPLDLPGAFWGTALTGMVYVGIELYNPGIFLFQVKGLAVVVKSLLLVAAAAAPDSALAILLLAIVIGGI